MLRKERSHTMQCFGTKPSPCCRHIPLPKAESKRVRPILPLLPSRIRTPFTICSVKRTFQLALLPQEAFAPANLPRQASSIRAALLLLHWGQVCCEIPQAAGLKALHWEGWSHSTLDKNTAWQTALFLISPAGIKWGRKKKKCCEIPQLLREKHLCACVCVHMLCLTLQKPHKTCLHKKTVFWRFIGAEKNKRKWYPLLG